MKNLRGTTQRNFNFSTVYVMYHNSTIYVHDCSSGAHLEFITACCAEANKYCDTDTNGPVVVHQQ